MRVQLATSLARDFFLLFFLGIRTLSPSHGGRAFTVIYAILGVSFYFFIVLVWSQKLLAAFRAVSLRSKFSSSNRKVRILFNQSININYYKMR